MKRKTIELLRFAFCAVLLLAFPLIRRIRWRTVWVINAGTEDDIKAYAPLWLAPLFRSLPIVPTGFLYSRGIGVSLVVGSQAYNEELASQPEACRRLIDRVSRLRAERISFNGIIPAAFHAHRLWPDDERFIRDAVSTIYMIVANLREIEERHPSVFERKRRVAIIGTGHTGAQVANRLRREGYEVVAFDPRAEAAERLDAAVEFAGMDHSQLKETGVAVFLSPCGDDGARAVCDQLGSGSVVLSDTHPKISRRCVSELRERGVAVYESALTRPGTFFFPQIPRWPRDTIPGCVGQALVETVGSCKLASQEEFDARVESVLTARLDVA